MKGFEELKNKKILVTGGAGFIGSHLVEELLKIGSKVRVVDNLSTGKFRNIESHIDEIEFILGDLSEYETAEQSVKDVEYILHQAAVPSVPRSVKDPLRTNRSIVTSTVNLFEAARKEKVKRIVQASSSSVYGNSPTLPKKEDMCPNPLSPYAVAKYTQETYGRVFSSIYGMSVVSLRYFNVFGPRQDPNSEYSAVIPKFVKLMMKDKKPTIYGDGETTRDFTYIKNVVSANLKSLISRKKVSGESFNIACGERISLNELVWEINRIMKKDIKPEYGPERVGDVKHSLADIEKAKDLIDYEVLFNFKSGLESFFDSETDLK